MKKNLLIVLFLAISLMGAFTLKANAQDSTTGCINGNVAIITTVPVLIADETTISYSKTVAKIECCNESMAKLILQKWEQLITRYNCVRKKDRHGVYKQYNIYLNKDDAQYIIKWSKSNL